MGKTELAKALANLLFDDEKMMVSHPSTVTWPQPQPCDHTCDHTVGILHRLVLTYTPANRQAKASFSQPRTQLVVLFGVALYSTKVVGAAASRTGAEGIFVSLPFSAAAGAH